MTWDALYAVIAWFKNAPKKHIGMKESENRGVKAVMKIYQKEDESVMRSQKYIRNFCTLLMETDNSPYNVLIHDCINKHGTWSGVYPNSNRYSNIAFGRRCVLFQHFWRKKCMTQEAHPSQALGKHFISPFLSISQAGHMTSRITSSSSTSSSSSSSL